MRNLILSSAMVLSLASEAFSAETPGVPSSSSSSSDVSVSRCPSGTKVAAALKQIMQDNNAKLRSSVGLSNTAKGGYSGRLALSPNPKVKNYKDRYECAYFRQRNSNRPIVIFSIPKK
jgi:hypothetical protein